MMETFLVSIEIEGNQVPVGTIESQAGVIRFRYYPDYEGPRISIGLPVQQEAFSPDKTKTFFNGLLPEGFTRAAVAGMMHTDEDNYIGMLYGLGRECLGAIRVYKEGEEEELSYEKLDPERVKALAREGAGTSAELVTEAHLSLAGATGKAGLYFDGMDWYLPRGAAPSTHIVKQSHVRFGDIVINEQLSLLTAGKLGINVPESFVLNVGSFRDEDVLFATRRYDRVMSETEIQGLKVPRRLHQEDFCQAMGIPGFLKYEPEGAGYMRGMFETIRNYSANPLEDQASLWDMIVFDFLIGNTDAHIKNFSLLYSENLKTVRLSPAYDILSTIIYPGTARSMGFRIGGDGPIENIDRESFGRAAVEAGLGKAFAMRRFDEMCQRFEAALLESARELYESGAVKALEIKEKILANAGYRNIS